MPQGQACLVTSGIIPALCLPTYTTNGVTEFAADHEATALGCLEQFQWCRAGLCGQWKSKADIQKEVFDVYTAEHDQTASQNGFEPWPELLRRLSVHEYLTSRTAWSKNGDLPLILNEPRPSSLIYWIETGWTDEVKGWFHRVFLSVLLTHQNDGTYVTEDEWTVPGTLSRLCGTALFRDGEFTNIN